jgi:hypothetical protein
LNDLTGDDVPFEWTEEREKAFADIRTCLTDDVVLPFPNFDLPFIVDCDASNVGMGAVLSQVINGTERPLSMESRKFTAGEKKWHIREKEALAIVYALEKFRRFILGRKFLVRSDHKSLEWLWQAKAGRLSRWALRLSEFLPFDIVHRSGKLHSNVDAFTRDFEESDCFPGEAFLTAITPVMEVPKELGLPSRCELIPAQARDKTCGQLLRLKRAACRDGVIGIGRGVRWRPVLPESMVDKVIQELHSHPLGGHLGARKLHSIVSDHFVIGNGLRSVQRVVNGCIRCKQRKVPQQKFGLLSSKPPAEPWKLVAVDFAGPLAESKDGNRFVLVFVDHFTKWVELIPTADQTAMTVVQHFYERIICRHGCPDQLLSDRGPQFIGQLMDTLCSYFGIQKIFSSAYYPQGDGFAERFMRTMNNALSAFTGGNPADWDKYLPGLAFAYNNSAHAATRVSPFYLNTGRIAKLPGEKRIGSPFASELDADELNYLKRLRSTITNSYRKARTAVESYWNKVKRQYDKGRKDIQLSQGDWILVLLSDYERKQFPCPKLAPRWSEPCQIMSCLENGVTYVVQRPNGVESVHVSRLLPLGHNMWDIAPDTEQAEERKTTALPNPIPTDMLADEEPCDVYIADKIVGCRYTEDGSPVYKVRWKGYAPEEDTWEPHEHLLPECQDLIDLFHKGE